MEAPHAHIDNVIGSRDKFGQDRQHLKTYTNEKSTSILVRPKINITSQLNSKPEFGQVRALKLRLKAIQDGNFYNKTAKINNSCPKTFNLSKKLQDQRHSGSFELNEHWKRLAAMQRNIASQAEITQRVKNKLDPVAHPSLFFRYGVDRKISIKSFKRKVLRKAEREKNRH